MQRPGRKIGKAVVTVILLGVSACATPQTGSRAAETDLSAFLTTIKQNDADGKTGTLKGIGFLSLPSTPPVVLDNAAVSLIPSTPALEAALRAAQQQWRQGRRRPVPPSEFQATFSLLDRHVRTIQAMGQAPLLRFAETDDKGRFSFEAVPAGRWLLVTTMDSPVSTILWAIPGDVGPAETVQVHVGGANILLEGRKAEETEPSPH